MDADRITHNLYLGSAPKSCGSFDTVVLAAEELQDIPLNCQVIHAPLDDAVPTPDEVKTAIYAARAVRLLRRRGQKVLVTCAQGINRSALIVALSLMMDGASASEAIRKIRSRRRGTMMPPLSNRAFVKTLKRYEKMRRRYA